MYFDSLWNEFKNLPEIEAIALGGSRAGTNYDKNSDYDLYIYCNQIPEESLRKKILEKCCQYMEIGNSYWELEDQDHNAYNGYTTCMWHNLLNSKILYDKNGRLRKLQKQYDIPYPEELRANIINKNMRLLTGNLPSYDIQIKKALTRKDLVSVNHRIAAFLESYFDIIFALNRLTHPGEKRMVQLALQQAEILPKNFENNLNKLFENMFKDSETTIQTLNDMITEIEKEVNSN